MKKQAFALAALSLLSISAAYAEEAKPDWTLTGNAGLFSDYRFRGYTQTAYKPAFQGGFDVQHALDPRANRQQRSAGHFQQVGRKIGVFVPAAVHAAHSAGSENFQPQHLGCSQGSRNSRGARRASG